MILVKLAEPSVKTMTMIEEPNELAWRVELDLVEENKERARVQEEAIK